MMKAKVAVLLVALVVALAWSPTAFADEGANGGGLVAGASDTPIATQGDLSPQAVKWKTITSPAQLRVLSLKSEGFGPGYYKIGADFSLSTDTTDPTEMACGLINGTYVIDFNGHTVQSNCSQFATFRVGNANVTFLDSKASASKPSVNALGVGCIEVLGGSCTILSGTYSATGTLSDSSALFVGGNGGKCTVNGGLFAGSYCAACNSNATLRINGGTFYGGYPYALLHMGGTTKIARGTFYGGSTVQGATFAIGMNALDASGSPMYVNMDSLLAKGSSWAQAFDTVYYNGQSTLSATPSLATNKGASYAQTVAVKGKVGAKQSAAVPKPTLKSVKAGEKQVTATWGKVSGASKYQVRYATAKNMKGAKTLNVSSKKASITVKKLKSGKRYYVQVRAFKKIGSLTYYSAWSSKKSAVAQ